jgi:UDP:flavonoid glycosyltransferase YjiC (YdhE family)
MRTLFVCNPLYGHLYPMLPLASAARAAGHDVVLATSIDMAPLLHAVGLSTWSIGITHAQAGGNRQSSWLDYFEVSASRRIAQLTARCMQWRPDLIIHEETELAGPVVAAALGVRSVVQGLGPMPPVRLLDWFAAAIERLASKATAKGVVDAWRRATYLHPCPPAFASAQGPIWQDVLALRPTTPGRKAEPALVRRIERLPHGRSVFLTLGTVYGGNTAALVQAVDGLRDLGVNLIVAVGPEGDPSHLERRGDHVLAERLVPLASVLARCTAVVSQGGSGVMFGAMAHALPQLMLPQGADQFRNAEVGVHTGAALALEPPAATPAAIGDAVDRLLKEASFTSAAQRLRGQIAAMPSADDAVAVLTGDLQVRYGESLALHRHCAGTARSTAVKPPL